MRLHTLFALQILLVSAAFAQSDPTHKPLVTDFDPLHKSRPAPKPQPKNPPKPKSNAFQSSPATLEGMRMLTAAIDAAILGNDLDTVQLSMDESFVSIDEVGNRRNKAEILGQYQFLLKAAKKIISCKTDVNKFRITPQGLSEVRTSTRLELDLVGPTGGPARVVITSEDTETWARKGGRWKQVTVRTSTSKVLIDGKPAEPIG